MSFSLALTSFAEAQKVHTGCELRISTNKFGTYTGAFPSGEYSYTYRHGMVIILRSSEAGNNSPPAQQPRTCTTGCKQTFVYSLQAGAALCLSAGLAAPAIAGEFDLLGLETPTNNYLIDDAGVLNKTTRKTLNNTLTSLEVRPCPSSCYF